MADRVSPVGRLIEGNQSLFLEPMVCAFEFTRERDIDLSASSSSILICYYDASLDFIDHQLSPGLLNSRYTLREAHGGCHDRSP